MHKLVPYQTKKGWMWKVVYTRGSISKILARSGPQPYSSMHHAIRAYENFMRIGAVAIKSGLLLLVNSKR